MSKSAIAKNELETEKLNETPKKGLSPGWEHAIPFVAWLLIMQFIDVPAISQGIQYVIRTVVCTLLFLYLRPWRYYDRPSIRHWPMAFGAGLVVLAIWIGLETPWANAVPSVSAFYQKFFILPFNEVPEAVINSPLAPENAGWPITIVRLLGSAVVIAVIEEFFWRGFLYRWLMGNDFLKVSVGKLDWRQLLIMSALFGLEHNRWAVGMITGVIYGLVMIRSRDIWTACLAHIVTNFTLGLYVLVTGSYQFW